MYLLLLSRKGARGTRVLCEEQRGPRDVIEHYRSSEKRAKRTGRTLSERKLRDRVC